MEKINFEKFVREKILVDDVINAGVLWKKIDFEEEFVRNELV